MTAETVEAEAVEVGGEIVPVEAASTTLFRTDDPVLVVKRAQETAEALKPIIEKPKMLQRIGDNDHPRIELLQTLGSMLGVTAVGDWTRETDNGWEARAEVKTLDGRVIGAAESMCERSEGQWKDADNHAIRSMAQTRAASKALASVMRFVLVLAGFSGTPAEEMDGAKGSRGASKKQQEYALTLLGKANFDVAEKKAIWSWATADGKLQKGPASKIIETLKDGTNEGRNELLQLAGHGDTPADESGLEPEGDAFDYEGDRDE